MAQGAAELPKIKVEGLNKNMEKVTEYTIKIGKRESTPIFFRPQNFRVLQSLKPQECTVSHLNVPINVHM